MTHIETDFTRLLKCELPIIGAPMFLVSNVETVVAQSEAGALGTFPALNFRPIEKYREALKEIKRRTKKPIGVNIIVNKSNPRQHQDLAIAMELGVEFLITSLGSPKEVIQVAHQNNCKVFCDVTNLDHALKVQDLGADGVIAVCQGAGGHAGPISPLALIPWLKSRIKIPIAAAGGIADGFSLAAVLALGASAASIGTRFIASTEAGVDESYKRAVVAASPEDIVMTTRISGTPAAVINTPYIQKIGTDLPFILQKLKSWPRTKRMTQSLIYLLGSRSLERAADGLTWKQVWSAGQSVAAIHSVLPCHEIIEKLIAEYKLALESMPRV